MSVDGWSLLMALAVILLPLVLAGVLLARPTRGERAEAPRSQSAQRAQRARPTAAGAPSNENP